MSKLINKFKKRMVVLASVMLVLQPLLGLAVLPASTYAAVANHIVISEVQDSQGGTDQYDNEFVELYNPTAVAIDLNATGIKMHIRDGSGADEYKTLTFVRNMIPANGFFLIAATPDADPTTPDYATTIGADATYVAGVGVNKLGSNGGVYISNSETNAVGTIYDKVGWGIQPLGGFENTAYTPTIPFDQSIERKANTDSTSGTMSGTDALKGNAWDTDVNSADFVARTTPDPQNSLSAAEPDIISPTVTLSTPATSQTNLSPFSVTAKFSENVTGFDASDVVVGIGTGTASNFIAVDEKTYTFDVTPVGFGLVTIDVAASVAIDGASNPNQKAEQLVVSVISPVVETPIVTPVVATVVVPETVVQNDQYGGDASSDQGEVRADTTVKADDGNNTENKDDKKEDTKEKKNIPLWGIIFLLILAGVGGYLFYSQNPEKANGKK